MFALLRSRSRWSRLIYLRRRRCWGGRDSNPRVRGSGSPANFPSTGNDFSVQPIPGSVSQERQVIIFTHNIWFATEVLRHFEKTPQDCFFYDVQSDGDVRGIVSRGTSPRSDTFNSLRGKINTLIQAAGPATGEVQQALVEKGYDHLRSLCEVVVETDLLQGVTKRYQPNVRMTVLDKIRCDRLPTAIEAIQPVFDKCCRQIAAHSQPLETLNVRANLTDLKADFAAVSSARDLYLNGK